MRIAVDTHCHSVASGHSYSTVEEIARAAARRRLKGFVLTDHGPAMEGTTHRYHFWNLQVLPRTISGVRVWHGVEANILDGEGKLDLSPTYLKRLDFVLASLHEICLEPGDRDFNTRTLEAALANPLVDAIAHPGNPAYPIDARRVVEAAKAGGKAIEINDSSFRIRQGSESTCEEIARLCAELECPVVCSSDAHWSGDIGRTSTAVALLKAVSYPKSGIVNLSIRSFEAFLERRKAQKT